MALLMVMGATDAENPIAQRVSFNKALRQGHATADGRFVANMARLAAPSFGANHNHHDTMNIDQFMQGYKAAWERRDESLFCSLFTADGEYHNTPFAVQRGHVQLAEYWQRVKLQEDVQVTFEVLASTLAGGIAHWHVTYQVASEELFQVWARSTGTHLVARAPGDPLPRMVLDGILQARFDAGLCRECRIWWHSMPQAA